MDMKNTATPAPRVLLVDDSAAVRQRLAQILEQTPGIGRVTQACDVASARAALADALPEVVVLDMHMPDGDGLELLAHIRERALGVRTIVLTNYPTPEYRQRCLALGADYFLDKTLEFQRVPSLIRDAPAADSVTPDQEMARLLTLLNYQILDTPAEQAFDDLTAIAARVCAVPIALISLVDADRQWFKSRHGTAMECTARSVAFCAHAIASDGLFEVEDARRDARFASNPLTAGEGGVVFYAGMPLTVDGGHNLGTLRVIDHMPRRLDAEQRAALAALARQAVMLLEHRRLGLDLQQQHESRAAMERALQALATRDALTGLDNRNAFRHALEHALTLAQRRRQRLACVYLDLDNFKLVNDSLGHGVGDALLVAASQRVKGAIRESDIFARLGGDEFAVLLHDAGNDAEIAHLAAKIRDLLCAPFVLGEHTVHVGCSLGIALAPDDGTDLDLLLRRADIALYHAKGEGKGDFRFYTPELNERVVQRVRLEQELRVAIDNEEFELHFQPQFTCDDERVSGVEVLLRWPRGAREPLGPAVFVALAEELRLGRRLGTWVLERACAEFARWRAAGIHLERLAVNITASQLYPEFVDEVLTTLARHQLPPAVLELEVVENHIMKDVDLASRVIRSLRNAGVLVALDDFGTGYSSLSLLRELEVDAIKIDRMFIDRVQCGDGDTAIVSALIALAHRLGLRVTAEGVEHTAQLVALRAMDCDHYQGYIASPAVPAAQVAALCREWSAANAN